MNPWLFLLIGYPVTIAVETPILMLGLSPRHPMSRRVFAGIWLTACTYPIVVLVMPPLLIGDDGDRTRYLVVAETFAHLGECVLFWLAFGTRAEFGRRSMWWDMAAVFLANLASFAVGEKLAQFAWWQRLFSAG
jgi:hypothetical protein